MAGLLRRESFSSKPVFSFEDLEDEARALLDRAREQGRQSVARAEEEGRRRAARLEQEAHARGLEDGRRRGFEQARTEAAETARQEARQDLAHLARALAEGLETFEESKRRLLARAECGLLELALGIARRVCKHDLGASSSAARHNARALLEMVKHEGDLQLHFSPAECDALRAAAADLVTSADRLSHVEIVSDPEVERGGCLLQTRHGSIDASLETQLEHVARALTGNSGNEDRELKTENRGPETEG